MRANLLANAKAYASLVGAIVTAVLGTVPPHSTAFTVLTIASAIATAVITWRVPNTPEAK